MLVSQKLAIAAHLHVLLRRKTGRVTDTEWMAENLEYATAVIRYARAKAREDGHPELAAWADKLEQAVVSHQPAPARPLAQAAMQLLRERQPPGAPAATPAAPLTSDSGFADVTQVAERKAAVAQPPRYVGGIR